LELIARGKDPRAIAHELGISVHTARGYVKNILAKFGVHSQTAALAHAIHQGLLATVEEPKTARIPADVTILKVVTLPERTIWVSYDIADMLR
jgi:hypothetical protein